MCVYADCRNEYQRISRGYPTCNEHALPQASPADNAGERERSRDRAASTERTKLARLCSPAATVKTEAPGTPQRAARPRSVEPPAKTPPAAGTKVEQQPRPPAYRQLNPFAAPPAALREVADHDYVAVVANPTAGGHPGGPYMFNAAVEGEAPDSTLSECRARIGVPGLGIEFSVPVNGPGDAEAFAEILGRLDRS